MRAARGGNVAAQNRVAKLYMQGLGVEPDSIAAAAWYIVSPAGPGWSTPRWRISSTG